MSDLLSDVAILIAEVKKKTSAGDTYKRNKNVTYPPGKRIVNEETNEVEQTIINSSDMLFAIDVQYSENGRLKFIENVKPYNANLKQIPIPGESVLIFQLFNHESTVDEYYTQWYYMVPMAPSSNTNSNILPTVTEDIELDEKFEQESYKVSPLQPYRGDLMLEGRFGNSIRFSSTIDFKNDYSLPGKWSGNKNGDPILILSNGREYKEDKQFVTEDIEKDKSSLYLTSTQKINNLKFTTTPLGFDTSGKSNFIGIADQVILRSKQGRTIVDSQDNILLNTPNQVNIGGDTNLTPLPQGDELQSILLDIAFVLAMPHSVQGAISNTIAQDKISGLMSKIFKMNSTKYKIKKNT